MLADTLASGLTTLNITLGAYQDGPAAFETTVRELAAWDSLLRQHEAKLLKVYDAADVLRAKRDRKLGVIYGFQDTVALGDRADRVEVFADLGVRGAFPHRVRIPRPPRSSPTCRGPTCIASSRNACPAGGMAGRPSRRCWGRTSCAMRGRSGRGRSRFRLTNRG